MIDAVHKALERARGIADGCRAGNCQPAGSHVAPRTVERKSYVDRLSARHQVSDRNRR